MSKLHLSLLSSALFLMALPATADDLPDLIGDRPDETESPYTVPLGFFQLELGGRLTVNEINSVRRETISVPETLLRIGLSPTVELRLGWSGTQDERRKPVLGCCSQLAGTEVAIDGIGDTEIGLKIGRAANTDSGLATAILLSTSLPTGDAEFTSDRFDPSIRLALGLPVSDRIDLGLNVGVAMATELDGADRDSLSSLVYSLVSGFGLTDRLGLYMEVFGDTGLSRKSSPANYLNAGVTYLVRPDIQLDIEGGIGMSHNADDWFAGIGLVVLWPR